jgi:hypothetical protein
MLASDVCSRPPITIKSRDLHASDIRRTMGKITSYHERDWLSSTFLLLHVVCVLTFLWPSFLSPLCDCSVDPLLHVCGGFEDWTLLNSLYMYC